MKNNNSLNNNIIDVSTAIRNDNHLKSKLSANALFNFMPEYGYLETIINNMYFSPRYNTEYVDYLELDYQGEKFKKWMIPMTCFCDIPLHQVSHHAEGIDGYGKFCIAIHKEFGIRNNIQPVQYLNPESVLTRNLKEAINILITNIERTDKGNPALDSDTYVTLTNYLFEHLTIIKPLYGLMDKKSRLIQKNFHDEHEWRYVPQLNYNELPPMLIDEEEILVEQERKIFTESIAHSKNGLLKFKVEDIRYIFVDTVESRDKLINFIHHKKGRKWTLEEKYLLVSKIKVYNELKEDW